MAPNEVWIVVDIFDTTGTAFAFTNREAAECAVSQAREVYLEHDDMTEDLLDIDSPEYVAWFDRSAECYIVGAQGEGPEAIPVLDWPAR